MEAKFNIITWGLSDPFGTLWQFETLKEAGSHLMWCIQRGLNYKVLD